MDILLKLTRSRPLSVTCFTTEVWYTVCCCKYRDYRLGSPAGCSAPKLGRRRVLCMLKRISPGGSFFTNAIFLACVYANVEKWTTRPCLYKCQSSFAQKLIIDTFRIFFNKHEQRALWAFKQIQEVSIRFEMLQVNQVRLLVTPLDRSNWFLILSNLYWTWSKSNRDYCTQSTTYIFTSCVQEQTSEFATRTTSKFKIVQSIFHTCLLFISYTTR